MKVKLVPVLAYKSIVIHLQSVADKTGFFMTVHHIHVVLMLKMFGFLLRPLTLTLQFFNINSILYNAE